MSSDLRIQFAAAPAALRLARRDGDASGRRRSPRRTPSEGGPSAAPAHAVAPSPAGAPATPKAASTSNAAAPAPRPAPAAVDAPPPAWALQLDRFDRVMTRLEAEAARLPSSVAEALVALEPDLVRLALAAASRVLRRRFDEGAEELGRLVADALHRITRGIERTEPVKVLVHPDDREALAAAVGERKAVEFLADEDRAAGTVEVRCGLRRIGLDVAREIDRLADRLLGDGGRDEPSDG